MKSLRGWLPGLAMVALAAGVVAGGQGAAESESFLARVAEFQSRRDHHHRTSPFSALALVHREYLKDGIPVTLGRGARVKVRLDGSDVAPLHAIVERRGSGVRLRAGGSARIATVSQAPERVTELALEPGTGWQIGRYNLRYIVHEDWGPTIEVYDSQHPQLVSFRGFKYFPADPAFRVEGEIVPAADSARIELIDSQGNRRPYWIYGTLRFELEGRPCQLEVYTTTLDPEEIEAGELMLMFSDETSGRESYPAARYLYIRGRRAGPVEVDFNRTFNPPCNYSSVYTCPFPRPQNRLPVAVRAGEKWYRPESAAAASKR